MDIKQMQCFCTIVEQGQISRAAQKLCMSQPPLSLRLKKLEEEVGATLITRTSGRWEITEEGQRLYTRAHQILTQIDNIIVDVHNIQEEISGVVRIGICTHCLSFFINAFPDIERYFPHVSCRLLAADSPTIERKLREREIEVAVLRLPLTHTNYQIFPLNKQRFMAIYSNLLPAPPKNHVVELEELCKYPLLFARRWEDAGGYRPIVVAFQTKKLTPKIILDTQNVYILFELLYSTPAIAIYTDTEIPQHHAHDFQVRQINYDNIFHPIIAYAKDSTPTMPAQAVIDLILRHGTATSCQAIPDKE